MSGDVQGVFFRESTRRLAERLRLAGWVRNLMDGRVEVVFEGDPGRVHDAAEWCRRGPPDARVAHVEVAVEPVLGETRFAVRATSSLA